jgi:UDP-glucose:(heptosyl)LPS alpha-1,3-glucosyltransferase
VLETPDLYHAADVFLLPTAYETFSLVTYEAAASALPLLVTAVSGIEDILVDGVTGLSITRDESQIALRLQQIAAAPAVAEQLGEEARRVTADYTWSAMVDRHRTLYRTAHRG